jgi:hypothetical protein
MATSRSVARRKHKAAPDRKLPLFCGYWLLRWGEALTSRIFHQSAFGLGFAPEWADEVPGVVTNRMQWIQPPFAPDQQRFFRVREGD